MQCHSLSEIIYSMLNDRFHFLYEKTEHKPKHLPHVIMLLGRVSTPSTPNQKNLLPKFFLA